MNRKRQHITEKEREYGIYHVSSEVVMEYSGEIGHGVENTEDCQYRYEHQVIVCFLEVDDDWESMDNAS